MKKALVTLFAGCALVGFAAPAFAQTYYHDTGQREDNLRARIDQGERDGALGAGQADRLRGELGQITDLDARYQDDGMTSYERRDLNSRLSLLASRLNYDLDLNSDTY